MERVCVYSQSKCGRVAVVMFVSVKSADIVLNTLLRGERQDRQTSEGMMGSLT